jgi:glycine C-acetyltransferase
MPAIAGASVACLDLLEAGGELRERLHANAARFREGMTKAGFTLAGAGHPIIPVMLGDAKVASEMAAAMMDEGIYVIGFSFPVVPKGQARIRTQMSAAHTPEHVDRAIAAFTKVGRRMGVIPA